LLFDRIKGYPPGRRILANIRTSRLLDEGRGIAAVQAFRAAKRQQEAPTIPPEEVASGPVFENVLMGDAVNVLAFPAPQWHDLDGGPYIGTECLIINQDPDTGWVNVGTYRVQVHDARTLTVFIEPGKHGNLIRQKYWERGAPCPMVVVVGQAPILGRLAGSSSRYGESELD